MATKLKKTTLTYTKTPISAKTALSNMQNRGLAISDSLSAESYINSFGYFRLTVYARKFQNATGNFIAGTDFINIVDIYEFDRKLKSITMSCIERIEVKLRAALSNSIAVTHGSHWYLEASHFEGVVKHNEILTAIIKATKLSNNSGDALIHYYNTYAQPILPPIWLVCEKLSFGSLSYFFANLKIDKRNLVSNYWQCPEPVLVSWFRTLTSLRNECAHHGRLWKRSFSLNPPLQHKNYLNSFHNNKNFYSRACVIALLLETMNEKQKWKNELSQLFAFHPKILIDTELGFPIGWESDALWS